MKKMVLDVDKYCAAARRTVAEGQVLLRNEGEVLPIPKGTHLAVFGRMQLNYYKSGTGSGGMVNVDKVTGILDALLETDHVCVDRELVDTYKEWEKTHPFDEGIGWGTEPWSQEEMVLSKEVLLRAAEANEYALVVIARTAGEDKDNQNLPGSYLLTELEEDMLKKVRAHFKKMIVVLNVGNIIDMSFVDTYQPEAVLYAWQGGMIGGYGTADVLIGRVNPSGKLSDTIAYRIEDYPSDCNFGNLDKDIYAEDIFVGYRYFETAGKDKVCYPFGFGLSYTSFVMETKNFAQKEEEVLIDVSVKNIGKVKGKEVVQIYVSAPQGKLGKPAKVLAGFAKTEELMPGEEQVLRISVPFYNFASYDETGKTGFKSAYVLEAGVYRFFAGNSARNVTEAGRFELTENRLAMQCSQAMAPKEKFERMHAVEGSDGSVEIVYEEVPLRTETPAQKREKQIPEALPLTGDRGYTLKDVKEGKVTMEEFIAQLSEEDLSAIIRGEGMGSPKVTPGTAAAFGGISESLKAFGIPCGCCADGPSGMRIDCGMKAFSLPNGTLLACTFNTDLVEEIYSFTGVELVKNHIDTLLGPGMNIHRHPLNGRNFEYFSEDPLLTGKMAAAQLRAFHKSSVTGTMKHFCANNQETKRHELDSVVSERALREIYLKGFEIAVKEGNGKSIMTTYGAVNGLWTAGYYDLNTVILRQEWGYEGIVMTDWWAKINEENVPANLTNFAAMARSQNDLYMVCQEADKNATGDNTLKSLKKGTLAVSELQRNAMNICRFLMDTPAFERMNGIETQVEVIGGDGAAILDEKVVVYHKLDKEGVISLENVDALKGRDYTFALDLTEVGEYQVEITARSELGELAQLPVTLFYQSVPFAVFTFNGTKGAWVSIERQVELHNKYAVLRLYFGQNGLDLKEIKFTYKRSLEEARAEK